MAVHWNCLFVVKRFNIRFNSGSGDRGSRARRDCSSFRRVIWRGAIAARFIKNRFIMDHMESDFGDGGRARPEAAPRHRPYAHTDATEAKQAMIEVPPGLSSELVQKGTSRFGGKGTGGKTMHCHECDSDQHLIRDCPRRPEAMALGAMGRTAVSDDASFLRGVSFFTNGPGVDGAQEGEEQVAQAAVPRRAARSDPFGSERFPLVFESGPDLESPLRWV